MNFINASIIANILFFIGVILSLIGLVYKLGFVNSPIFQYCFAVGIILLGAGVLFSGFDKRKEE